MVDYTTVSLPRPLLNEINRLIKQVGFWPSLSSFVREACLEKLHAERMKQRAFALEAEG